MSEESCFKKKKSQNDEILDFENVQSNSINNGSQRRGNRLQIKQIQNELDEAQNRIEKLTEVKDNLIKFKAGDEDVNEQLLKEQLTEEELNKIQLAGT